MLNKMEPKTIKAYQLFHLLSHSLVVGVSWGRMKISFAARYQKVGESSTRFMDALESVGNKNYPVTVPDICYQIMQKTSAWVKSQNLEWMLGTKCAEKQTKGRRLLTRSWVFPQKKWWPELHYWTQLRKQQTLRQHRQQQRQVTTESHPTATQASKRSSRKLIRKLASVNCYIGFPPGYCT